MTTTVEMLKFKVQLGELAAGYLKQMFSGTTNAEGLKNCITNPVSDELSSQVVVLHSGSYSFSVLLPSKVFDERDMGDGMEYHRSEPKEKALSRQIESWVNTARGALYHPQEYAVNVESVAPTAAP